MSTCPYDHDDAAYVLGALSPEEHRAFEAHLATCDDCRASVRRLAGLPGLLSRVDAPDDPAATDRTWAGPAPATLLPRLLSAAASENRRSRRRVVTLLAAACLVLVAALVVPLAVLRGPADRTPAAVGTTPASPSASALPAGTVRRILEPTAATVRVTAQVDVSPVRWGTRFRVHCAYGASTTPTRRTYDLVVVARDGGVEKLGSWSIGPDEQSEFEAPTASRTGDLAAVEIRTKDGRTLLRADL